jgi:predicted metal-binding membrane protein
LYLGLLAGPSLLQGGDLLTLARALCRPLRDGSAFGMPSPGAPGFLDVVLIALMWSAMALAMMLPSAGPMILTYAEIADTASGKGEKVVTPFALAAGYAAIWLAFAAGAALLQVAMMRAGVIDDAMAPAARGLSAVLFVLAGIYQFSPLKQACLRACQRPFPFFFANWKTTGTGVFALGLRQGLHCLGCCWAMMLLMFAVGVMNILWMAALAVVMTVEKMSSRRRVSRIVGVTLIGTGLVLLGADIVALLSHPVTE